MHSCMHVSLANNEWTYHVHNPLVLTNAAPGLAVYIQALFGRAPASSGFYTAHLLLITVYWSGGSQTFLAPAAPTSPALTVARSSKNSSILQYHKQWKTVAKELEPELPELSQTGPQYLSSYLFLFIMCCVSIPLCFTTTLLKTFLLSHIYVQVQQVICRTWSRQLYCNKLNKSTPCILISY